MRVKIKEPERWPDLRGRTGLVLQIDRSWAQIDWQRVDGMSWLPCGELEEVT